MSPGQAKAQVLKILSEWPLFGSSFFAVRRESDPKEGSEHILALNKNGVSFLDLATHETLLHYPFTEVVHKAFIIKEMIYNYLSFFR